MYLYRLSLTGSHIHQKDHWLGNPMSNEAVVTTGTEQLSVKIADVIESAASLKGRAHYYREFFSEPGVDLHDRLAVHVVVCRGGEVVAGGRMLGPTPLPLDIKIPSRSHGVGEKLGGRVVQLGGFWLHAPYRRVSTATAKVSRLLFGKMRELAKKFGASTFVLRTSEARMIYWYRALGFERAPELDYADPVWGQVLAMVYQLEAEPSGLAPGLHRSRTLPERRRPTL